jgi:trehalose-6-phosphate synthase
MSTSFAHIDLFKQFPDPMMARPSTASAGRNNLYDTDGPAGRKIREAIEMPVEEKQRRFRGFRGKAETNNVDAGSDSFFDTLLRERPLVS